MCSRSCPTQARLSCVSPILQPPEKPQKPHQQWRQQVHQAQGTEQQQLSHAHGTVPQWYPAFTQLSPGEQTSHQRQGLRARCQHRGQLTLPEAPTDLPWPWAVLRNLPDCPKPCAESPALLFAVSPAAPLRISSCFPSGHLETEIHQQKKNLTRAGKAPVPSSGKPREDPLQHNHTLERRNLWGEQMREKSRPHRRGVLELRELPPLRITHTPLWLLWGRGNPSHGTVAEQVPPVALEQPQPLPAPTGALWSGHHGHPCDHLG